MKIALVTFIILLCGCSQKRYLRSPANYSSKYEAFTPGTLIKLRAPVEGAYKEETIFEDDRCEVQKYCTFEIDNDPLRRVTMRGEFTVDSINEKEDKLILKTNENEKIQFDCGLKYTMKKISVQNDRYCEKHMKDFVIYTFPEFMQTIVEMDYTWTDHH